MQVHILISAKVLQKPTYCRLWSRSYSGKASRNYLIIQGWFMHSPTICISWQPTSISPLKIYRYKWSWVFYVHFLLEKKEWSWSFTGCTKCIPRFILSPYSCLNGHMIRYDALWFCLVRILSSGPAYFTKCIFQVVHVSPGADKRSEHWNILQF